jgi:hypothetical protein
LQKYFLNLLVFSIGVFVSAPCTLLGVNVDFDSSFCHVMSVMLQQTKDSKLITRCRHCRPCCFYIVKRGKMGKTNIPVISNTEFNFISNVGSA